jgi:hypothetical protein
LKRLRFRFELRVARQLEHLSAEQRVQRITAQEAAVVGAHRKTQ